MRCAEVDRLVDRYVDGGLPAARSVELERHVRTCGACRRMLDEARGVRRMLAADAVVGAPSGFADRLMDRVYRETLWKPAASRAGGVPARGYRRLGLSVMLGAAAAVALLVVPRGLPGASGHGPAGGGAAVVERMLEQADGAVRGVLSAAGGSAARIVEGGTR